MERSSGGRNGFPPIKKGHGRGRLRFELTTYHEGLRTLLMDALNEEEVWIVYHPLTRIIGDQKPSLTP